MIPHLMEEFLRKVLPDRTWKNRLIHEAGMCFMDFNSVDVNQLGNLGIKVDQFGPKLLACMWDEETSLEIGGYLVVDNLAMGRPAIGGVRMLPQLLPGEIYNLARAMTLKNAAANLPYGGGKVGILADPDLPPEVHKEIVRRLARLLYRYRDIFLPGPDVGTTDADMKIIAVENGLDSALSKPIDMGGSHNDQLGAAGGGLVIALQALLEEMPRLSVLSQFTHMQIPDASEITIITQGFGSVGSHTARLLCQEIKGAKVVGISDTSGYLFNPDGLPISDLFNLRSQHPSVCLPFYHQSLSRPSDYQFKFSNYPDDLLRESAFCFIPAAPISHYLDTDPESKPTMIVDRMGKWSLIIEGANIYSADSSHRVARQRMERAVYRDRGIMIANDFLVNSGGVIFAAQEHRIKTPPHLRIPDELLGKEDQVNEWLAEHAEELVALAEKRRVAAQTARNEVILRNMHELVSLLITDPDLLPCEAAEQISINRMTQREHARTAKDIMERIVTIPVVSSIQDAACLLVETACPLLAVVNPDQKLVGVVTDYDITRASAEGLSKETELKKVMTKEIIAASPGDTILEVIRKLEYHEISAMPVVESGHVIGIISSDLLTRRSLYSFLISNR